MNTLKHILTVALALLCFQGQAQTIPIDVQQQVVVGASNIQATVPSLEITEEHGPYIAPLRKKVYHARLASLLDLGADYELGAIDFKAILEYRVFYFQGGTQMGATPIQSLEVDASKPEILKLYDFKVELDNQTVDEIRLQASSITFVDNAGVAIPPSDLLTYLEANVRWTCSYEISYGIDVRLESNGLMANAPVITPKNLSPLVNRLQTFTWTPNNSFSNYEFQLLRLYNVSPSNAYNFREVEAVVDWSKALKVETQTSDPSLTLAIAEGTGFYLWRVRPIGNYFDGGMANSNNYGAWSTSAVQGSTMNFGTNLSTLDVFYYTDPDHEINWSYSRVFTEGDNADGVRTAEGIAYADGLGRGRQQQAYMATENQVMVGQSIPDYNGGAGISVLPVPLPGHLEGYKVGLVQTMSDDLVPVPVLYTAKYYDQTSNYLAPQEVIQSSGTPHEYYAGGVAGVADAEGYPFARSIAKNDGTGRVAEVSGVGKVHSLGTRTNGQGRTTRILYGSPSDDELIRIFGDEAPLAASVLKTITIDPNDVVSVTYTSKEGHVIATALGAYHTGINLEDVDQAPAQPLVVNNTTTEGHYTENRFFSNRRLVLSELTYVDMVYRFLCQSASWGCQNNGECKYNIRFHLYDITSGENFMTASTVMDVGADCNGGGEIVPDYTQMQWLNSANGVAPPASTSTSTTYQLHLPAGEYMLVKEVWSDLDDDFVDQKVDNVYNEIGPLLAVITGWLDGYNNAEDQAGFGDELDALNLALTHADANAVASGYTPYTNPLYQAFFEPVESAFGIDPVFVYNPDIVFEYDEDDATNDPGQLTYDTPCCGPKSIDIGRANKCVECDAIELARVNGTLTMGSSELDLFMQYVADKQMPFLWADMAPGFSEFSMKFMLVNMLNSKYYTGYSKEVGTVRYQADMQPDGSLLENAYLHLDPDPNPLAEFNYGVKDIIVAWKQAVDLYFELLGMTFEDSDIYSSVDDDQGKSSAPDDDGTSENMFDDVDMFESSEALNWLLNAYISVKMYFFSKNDGLITAERQGTLVTLPYLFMQAAGYQYAGIIDDNVDVAATFPDYLGLETYANYDLNTDEPAIDAAWPAASWPGVHEERAPYITIVRSGEADKYELFYPNTLRPEWMFKYYVHNSEYLGSLPHIDDTNEYLKRLKHVELSYAYEDPEVGCTPVCYSPAQPYSHSDWDMATRLTFYNVTKFASDETMTPADLVLIQSDDCSSYDLSAMVTDRLAAADLGVEYRRSEIKQRISAMLAENCYELVECALVGDPSQISEAELELMVQAVIDRAHEEIDSIRLNPIAPYPSCNTGTPCYIIDESGVCQSIGQIDVILFAPCHQSRLDQIRDWSFIPAMAPLAGCTNSPPLPTWYGETDDNCPVDPNNSNGEPVSPSYPVTINN
jgi:hypothetical protein